MAYGCCIAARIRAIRVNFVTRSGETVSTDAAEGDRLLDVAQAVGMPLEGTCEGQMACSTCHVIVAPEWFAKLDKASEDEEDMLDLAAGACRTSRLSCQIVLSEALDGLKVSIPADSHDMQVR
jgi:ferredoxin